MCVDARALDGELARLGASEIVLIEGSSLDVAGARSFDKAAFSSQRAEARLKGLFGVATLDGFGSFSRAELSAIGGLLAYLDHAGQGRLPHLAPPVHIAPGSHMAIDAGDPREPRDHRNHERQPGRQPAAQHRPHSHWRGCAPARRRSCNASTGPR
jgi:DNA mismatch repair ATPase MutS